MPQDGLTDGALDLFPLKTVWNVSAHGGINVFVFLLATTGEALFATTLN
jgi:hypothetical protein